MKPLFSFWGGGLFVLQKLLELVGFARSFSQFFPGFIPPNRFGPSQEFKSKFQAALEELNFKQRCNQLAKLGKDRRRLGAGSSPNLHDVFWFLFFWLACNLEWFVVLLLVLVCWLSFHVALIVCKHAASDFSADKNGRFLVSKRTLEKTRTNSTCFFFFFLQ